MNERPFLIFSVCCLLLGAVLAFRESGGSYSYPSCRVKLAAPRARRVFGRRLFWTSGFV
jgi:hypothetical protein